MYFGVSSCYPSGASGLILVLGTISSSGVTEAIYEYWQYYEPVRIYGPQKCVKLTQKLVNLMDNIFAKYTNTTQPAEELKALFGLEGVEYVRDLFHISPDYILKTIRLSITLGEQRPLIRYTGRAVASSLLG